MYFDIIDATYLCDYRIWTKFEDGTEGIIDFKDYLDGEIYEPLKDPMLFKSFIIHPELKVLAWANGTDFAPEFVYSKIRK